MISGLTWEKSAFMEAILCGPPNPWTFKDKMIIREPGGFGWPALRAEEREKQNQDLNRKEGRGLEGKS
jgi:hypothetical protein